METGEISFNLAIDGAARDGQGHAWWIARLLLYGLQPEHCIILCVLPSCKNFLVHCFVLIQL